MSTTTKKYLHHIDLQTNRLLNARIHPVTTAERTALGTGYNADDEGVLVYDITLDGFYVWDGTQWVLVTLSATQIQQIQDSYNKTVTAIDVTSNETDRTITLTRRDNTTLSDTYTHSYIHTQGLASDTWTITHNLGRYPSITVVDSSNKEVIGDIQYITLNQVVITFNGGFSGKAYLN